MTATLILVCESIGSQHQFGPNGGAFGRSRKCDWVLPDQDRHLSSVHARVLYQNDAFILVDESTNGTFLEGQSAAIGRGKAVSLSPGMKLRAGPYQIRVESIQSGPATQTNPFSAVPTGAAGRAAQNPTPLRIDTSGASLPKNTSLDPLDHLGGGGAETLTPVASVQPQQSLIPEPVSFSAPPAPLSPHETTRFQAGPQAPVQPAPAVQSPPGQPPLGQPPVMTPPGPLQAHPGPQHQPAAPAVASAGQTPAPATASAGPAAATPRTPASGTGNVIPEDFLAGLAGGAPAAPVTPPAGQAPGMPDLSALMPAAPANPSPPPATAPDGAPAKSAIIPDNIDFGFGTKAAPEPAPPAATPSTPAAAPPIPAMQTPAMGASAPSSPAPAAPGAAAAPPSEPPLNPLEALKKRRAQREAELAQKAKSRAGTPATGAKPSPAAGGKLPAPPVTQAPPVSQAPPVAQTSAVPVPPPPGQTSAGQPPALPLKTPAAPAAPATPSPPAATVPARPGDGGDAASEVFQTLLAGLGFADADVPPEEQTEIARATGEMVRELANGLIALLNARKSLKTEFRMYETRIQPEENNPFKHFNVGELAIDEMLFARKGGFLPPSEAAKEAFKDLQSHTMLTVAATQRAMRILFESLSPETLAGEEDDGGLRLKTLGSRRGKFEAAKERHDRLRADFDAVVRQTIAEAFVQVEEDQARQQSKTFWENRKK